MAALSDYLENALLDHSLGTSSFTAPASVYVALFTTAPTDAGGGTEVTGGGYAREQVVFAAAAAGRASNTASVEYAVATADWGTVSHLGIFDAATGGNLLYHGAANPKTIEAGDSLRIQAGNLTITLD